VTGACRGAAVDHRKTPYLAEGIARGTCEADGRVAANRKDIEPGSPFMPEGPGVAGGVFVAALGRCRRAGDDAMRRRVAAREVRGTGDAG
jgi:hypothetical protein